MLGGPGKFLAFETSDLSSVLNLEGGKETKMKIDLLKAGRGVTTGSNFGSPRF